MRTSTILALLLGTLAAGMPAMSGNEATTASPAARNDARDMCGIAHLKGSFVTIDIFKNGACAGTGDPVHTWNTTSENCLLCIWWSSNDCTGNSVSQGGLGRHTDFGDAWS
ncbi:hypothetical protein BCR34DRAFT_587063 [Clohesyomyces aquaticus]|uniref:Uncharacterized protein n=1 Tax=Clohesyomyces aquaticus TaxID=1231657 RepID=A0A1Y1ZQR7_9PLEO|nr:hypothetical protein BCR34DRAFT_587063 [Clohesyomyces aquaticus]